MFYEGQQLGEYTLIKKLGRGGFGEVWLAENAGACFAVKLPHKEQVDWKSITQEIGLWVLCGKHKNVLPLVGARNFNGQIAIISEYAPDGSLEDLLTSKGKFSEKEAVEMTIEILEGLAHLHESGIIHRDLKPANILLDGETPRLADFGISRIVTTSSSSQTASGTWWYMAPEAFDGKRNVRTDIWSVGVIVYRMLAGNLPFPQKEQTALIGAIIMREPELLSDSVPAALQSVVSKALAKSSTVRYQTANEMRQDLQDISRDLSQLETIPVYDLSETITIIAQSNLQLIPYRKGDKWGFCDADKNVLIEPKYNDARQFSEGLARVKLNGKYGFVDRAGQEVIPFKYDHGEKFKEGLSCVASRYKYGFVDRAGQEIIPLKYCGAYSFSEGLARVQLNLDKKMGFVDRNGREVISLKYDFVDWFFSEGLAGIGLNHKYGFVDKEGREVIPLKYDDTGWFNEGLAYVSLNDKHGFINKNGQEVIPLKYEAAEEFREGLARVTLNEKVGFVDKTGREVTAIKYDSATIFSEGLASVKLEGKIRFIDKMGIEVIALNYGYIECLSEGLAIAKLKGKTGFIDKTGRETIELKYDDAWAFDEGIALVELKGKQGFIGLDGTEYFDD